MSRAQDVEVDAATTAGSNIGATHAAGHSVPQHGSAAGHDPAAALPGPSSGGMPDARISDPPGLRVNISTPTRTRGSSRQRRAKSSPPRGSSRSPRGHSPRDSAAPPENNMGVPMNHEQLRWWTIREVGALHDRDRETHVPTTAVFRKKSKT